MCINLQTIYLVSDAGFSAFCAEKYTHLEVVGFSRNEERHLAQRLMMKLQAAEPANNARATLTTSCSSGAHTSNGISTVRLENLASLNLAIFHLCCLNSQNPELRVPAKLCTSISNGMIANDPVTKTRYFICLKFVAPLASNYRETPLAMRVRVQHTLISPVCNRDLHGLQANEYRRMEGESYAGFPKNESGLYKQSAASQEPRRTGPPCCCKKGEDGKLQKCSELSENLQSETFRTF
jgi:hypothetical protein